MGPLGLLETLRVTEAMESYEMFTTKGGKG